MEFFQTGPAETTQYMIAGFGVIFGVLGLYIASLIIRRKNLERDMQALEKLEGAGK